jgi:antitoxin FitA
MTNINLELLQPQITQRLKARAHQNGRSIEAEIAAILSSVLISESPQTEPLDPATAIQRRFADIEDFEIPEIPRERIRTPPTF